MPPSHQKDITCAGVKSNDGRASLSLPWAQTHERPRPSHAADPATTSAGTRKWYEKMSRNKATKFLIHASICSESLVTSTSSLCKIDNSNNFLALRLSLPNFTHRENNSSVIAIESDYIFNYYRGAQVSLRTTTACSTKNRCLVSFPFQSQTSSDQSKFSTNSSLLEKI